MLDIPIDRVTGNFWQNPNSPVNTINYNMFGANANFIMSISGIVANIISTSYNQSPVNTYVFNKMSMNNWANNDFAQLLNTVANAISSNPAVANNPSMINGIIEEAIFNIATYYFTQYVGDFQILLSNNPQAFQIYMNRAVQLGLVQNPGMNMPYGGQMAMPVNAGVNYNNQPGFINANQPSPFAQNRLSTDLKNIADLKASNMGEEDINVNRSEHEGVPGAVFIRTNNEPVVSKAAPVKVEPVKTSNIFIGEKRVFDENASPENIIPNYEVYDEAIGFSSFKEISDDIFIRYEKFFYDDNSDFPYVYCPNVVYINPIPPFSKKANYLMIIDMYKKFLSQELTSDEMAKFRNGIHPKFAFVMDVLYIQLCRRINTILSTCKIGITINPHVDNLYYDYTVMLKNHLISTDKEFVNDELKESLPKILDEYVSIQNKDNVFSLMNKIPIIIVNMTNDEFIKYNIKTFKFMSEHNQNLIVVITNDNYMHIIDFESRYDSTAQKINQYMPKTMSVTSILR